MPEHRSSAYLSSSLPGRRPDVFRTVRLNAVGSAAVAGLCVIGAAAGWAVARLTGVPTWIASPAGGAAAFTAVVAADRNTWATQPATYSWSGSPGEVERITAALQRLLHGDRIRVRGGRRREPDLPR